jgi:hypothetical protein
MKTWDLHAAADPVAWGEGLDHSDVDVDEGAVAIRLEAACFDQDCADLAFRFRNQLGVPKYSQGASVLTMPASLADWRAEHRTARKRADRAQRLGYRFTEIDYSQHNDAIFAINTSLATRQGQPMTDGYTTRHNHGPLPDYPCDRHRVHTYGVLKDETLVAYLTLYVVGELKLVSTILGHAADLSSDVMYALFVGVVERHAGTGGVFYYNRWDSGQDGLRYFKSKLGFREADVSWVL